MNINMEVLYSLKGNGSVLCFRHAVHAALAGQDIETQVDDFGGEGDMRNTSCHMCLNDTFNEVFKEPEVYCPSYDDEPDVCSICHYEVCVCLDEDDEPELTPKERDIKTRGFHIRKKNVGKN